MIFQDPFACLHPMYRVGDQIAEAVPRAREASRSGRRTRAPSSCSTQVGIPNARGRARDYPHQFSGGMRQRAMIAMALVHNPDVLIADEPTTALDVTVQAQIVELIDRVKKEFDIGVILITHDLGVVAETATHVMVMYAGRAMEYGPAHEIFNAAQHPYTWGLLESMPTVDRRLDAPDRDRGLAAVAAEPAARLRVPSALQVPLRAVRQGAAAARADARAATSTPAICRPSASARSGPSASASSSASSDGDEPGAASRREPRRPTAPLVEVEHLTKHFPVRQGVFARGEGRRARGRGRDADRATAARRSASSASPAAASRRRRG